MTNLTPWFDPKVDGQPVRVGWYERDWGQFSGAAPDYWDGKDWWLGDGEGSANSKSIADRCWRGLTSPDGE